MATYHPNRMLRSTILGELIILLRRFRDFVIANEPLAGPLLAVAIAALVFALLAPFTPPIAFNNGLGYDGRVYADLTAAMRGDHSGTVVPPWSFRLLPSAIVAASGLDVRLGFLLVNLLAGLGSAWLLYRLLRHYEVSPPLILLAVGGWAVLPLGLRWAIYYPVLPDTLGFFLLLALIVTGLEGRFLLFAGLLIAGALTRENLIAMGPFLWFIHVRRDPLGVTVRSLAVGLAAVAVYFAVRVFPVVPPPLEYENWAERYNIGVNLRQVFENYDAHAWRYGLAALLSLGMFFALPFAWPRQVLALLGRERHWAYYLVMTFVVALVGGRGDDRYLYALAPALAVFVVRVAPSTLWRSAWRVGALAVLHLLAVRFLWPVGASESEFLQYEVSAMPVDRLTALTILCGVLAIVGLAVARVNLRALDHARGAKAEASA
jgi:hypothetical protein